MISKSLNLASYITYCTDIVGDIVENEKGLYVFKFDDTEEIIRVEKEYRRKVGSGEKIFVDIVRYNKIIFLYKNLIKSFKKKAAEDIILGDKEFKHVWKKKEERLEKVDKICDKVLENMEK